ncbi:hypothetical protein Syun_028387 [Stephania yunnanensis]|uniref:Uncharacterized protein n=1 Tax=Stephania yunnanensis TaxID=152371 RepID=A0AAP0EH97_9MAGN
MWWSKKEQDEESCGGRRKDRIGRPEVVVRGGARRRGVEKITARVKMGNKKLSLITHDRINLHCSVSCDRVMLGIARIKTTDVPKESEQEKENTGKMGEQVGRRAQTTSYKKENELRRGAGASQTGWEKKEKVMRTEIMKEKIEKVEKEMKNEVEVKEQVEVEVEVEVAVLVVVGVEVKVKMVPLKKMRKEMQVREIKKEVKVKRDKISKKWWKCGLVLRHAVKLSRDHPTKWRLITCLNPFQLIRSY